MSKAKSKLAKQFLRLYNREEKKKAEAAARDLEVADRIVLDYSYHDQLKVIGEIVYTDFAVSVCSRRIEAKLGYVPQAALEHDFGEVLNLQ